MKTNWNKWEANAELLRNAMRDEQPAVTIEKVMQTLGYSSKCSAEYALIKLETIGAVKWIDGKWYLV
jgi:hypothetical protein